LSARQGLNARLAGDRDGLLKSRIYRLEQALARSMVHQRRVDHATAVRAEARGVINEIRALLESRLDFAQGQLEAAAAGGGRQREEALARGVGQRRRGEAHGQRQHRPSGLEQQITGSVLRSILRDRLSQALGRFPGDYLSGLAGDRTNGATP